MLTSTLSYRYEERNNGYEGISFTIDLAAKEDIDNEPETKGLPTNLAIPLRQINLRIGRPLPHLSTFDITIYNVSENTDLSDSS